METVKQHYHYTTPDTLEKIADVVDQGWCRAAFHKKGRTIVRLPRQADRHCVYGASEIVGTKSNDWYEAVFHQLNWEGVYQDPIMYNDSQRDKRKVSRLLRRTARNLRNKRGPFSENNNTKENHK
jgi:hypothetical protein